jgi:adenylate cyclase
MVAARSAEDTRLSAIQGAFLVFREVATPVLVRAFDGDYRLVHESLQLILAAESWALQLFADLYHDAITARLRETNDHLADRNRELAELSTALDHRVHETTAALRDSRDFLTEVIDSLKSGLVVVDRKLNIRMFNRAMERLTGLAGDEVIGCRADKVLLPRTGMSLDDFRRELRDREVIRDLSIPDYDGAGGQRSVVLSLQPWRDAGGRRQGYLLFIDDVTERERLASSLSCYLSPSVAEQIITARTPLRLSGSRAVVSVMFADLRGFTFQTATMDPEAAVELLNAYLRIMVAVVSRHQGTLDKFIGDGIMALFGAPLAIEDDAGKAVLCAVEMQEEIGRFTRQCRREGKPHLYLGIGINRGDVVVGNIGAPERMDYTAIGTTVNLAARLQGLARGGEILISDAVYQSVRDQFQIRALPPGVVKGAREHVSIYVCSL